MPQFLYRYPTLFLLVALLYGCDHKDIIWPGDVERSVTVSFIWDKADKAQVDGMTLYFYPINRNARIWRFDIANREGGRIELPTGQYRLIAYNNDLPGITVSGQQSYTTLTANARLTDNSSRGTTAASLMPTGMLYRGTVDHIEVTPCGVSYLKADGSVKECPLGLIRCYPDSLSTVYNVEISNIKGIEHVRSASARLYGTAMSRALWSGLSYGNAYSTSLPLSIGKNSMRGTTTGFSSPASDPSYYIAVAALRTDGKTVVKKIDVTDQVINSLNPLNVLIKIDGLEIPSDNPPVNPPGDDDVGIQVGVDGWSVIDIYL